MLSMSSNSPKEDSFLELYQCKRRSKKMKGWDAVIHIHNRPEGLGIKNLYTKMQSTLALTQQSTYMFNCFPLDFRGTVYIPKAKFKSQGFAGSRSDSLKMCKSPPAVQLYLPEHRIFLTISL